MSPVADQYITRPNTVGQTQEVLPWIDCGRYPVASPWTPSVERNLPLRMSARLFQAPAARRPACTPGVGEQPIGIYHQSASLRRHASDSHGTSWATEGRRSAGGTESFYNTLNLTALGLATAQALPQLAIPPTCATRRFRAWLREWASTPQKT